MKIKRVDVLELKLDFHYIRTKSKIFFMETARKVNDQIIDLYIYEYQEKHNVCLVKVGAKRWRTVLTEIDITLKEIIKNIDEL